MQFRNHAGRRVVIGLRVWKGTLALGLACVACHFFFFSGLWAWAATGRPRKKVPLLKACFICFFLRFLSLGLYPQIFQHSGIAGPWLYFMRKLEIWKLWMGTPQPRIGRSGRFFKPCVFPPIKRISHPSVRFLCLVSASPMPHSAGGGTVTNLDCEKKIAGPEESLF